MSDMQIASKITKMRDFLKDGYSYGIPDFQRPYSWDDDNLSDFIKDIENISESDDKETNDNGNNHFSHFIGSIISYEQGYKDSVFKKAKVQLRSVIDGQQRITTTLILLSVLRDMAYKHKISISEGQDRDKQEEDRNLEDFIDSIDKMLHPRSDYSFDGFRYVKLGYNSSVTDDSLAMEPLLRGPEDSKNEWQKIHDSAIILKGKVKNPGKVRILNAYKFFTEYITQETGGLEAGEICRYLTNLKNKVLLLEYVDIVVNNFQSAFNIFMTLNDRGMELNNADLIKSHMIRNTASDPLGNFDKRWKNFIDILAGDYVNHDCENVGERESSNNSKISEDSFLISFAYLNGLDAYLSSSERRITGKNVFRCYEKFLSGSSEIKDFIFRIEEEAQLYRLVFDPNFFSQISYLSNSRKKNEWKRVATSLSALNLLGIRQHATFAYQLIRLCTILREGKKTILTIGDVAGVFEALESFHFQYNGLMSLPTNAVTDIYLDAVTKISSICNKKYEKGNQASVKTQKVKYDLDKMIKKMKELLERRNVTKEKFIEEFIAIKYDEKSRSRTSKKKTLSDKDYLKGRGFEKENKDNSFIQYVLSKYQPSVAARVDDYISIEHIYPFSKGGEEVNLIGNLMILPGKVNQTLKDSEVKDKFEKLKMYSGDEEFIEIPDSWKADLGSAKVKDVTESIKKTEMEISKQKEDEDLEQKENELEELKKKVPKYLFNERARSMAVYGYDNIWNI